MSGRSVVLLLVIFLLRQESARSIRITDLTVPSHVVEGGSVLLECHNDLEGEMLYSIKWYKDNREFYRYVPSNVNPFSYFRLPGVNVDEKDSSSNVVKLVNLSPETAGRYRCEVSGEGPYFVTVSDEKNITVHLLPYKHPQVTGFRDEYKVGDIVAVNCSSSMSRPHTQLKWLINDQPVLRRYITGPWYRISRERPDAKETILQLRFIITNEHFRDGILLLKCQASIAPLYQEEVVHHIVRAEDDVTDSKPVQVVEEELDEVFGHERAFLEPVGEIPMAEPQNDHGNILHKSLAAGISFILIQVFL
ncbi:uncharacterized protein LOC126971801 [Leptidea sinapis]|uniref:uncharacterized protein LOC126971801 n=1 Tax=Leptidea sinapis TaxID=189913 RepID=UPI00212949CD|nr:uncharacterized protein LOC126971801 [Leptidea sinapis]XP_050674181.1 uncharacterized protein LOC126971801 [Leptidea sinapis]